jgi:endonuclease VIII
MPEGPSIVILKEEVNPFKGKKVIKAGGNTSVDISFLEGRKVTDFKSWGKHFLISIGKKTVRIHFLLFGSYSINEKRENKKVRLFLQFANGTIYFYTCSVKIIEEPLDDIYDWSADVMSDAWNPREARKKLKAHPEMLVCDALLNQDIFAGVGNIIKNEVLFRIKVHPQSVIGKLPPARLTALIKEARNYSFDFLLWKKAYVLRKHWLAHTKKTCPRCKIPLIKAHLGKTNRRTFFCNNCQVKYS